MCSLTEEIPKVTLREHRRVVHYIASVKYTVMWDIVIEAFERLKDKQLNESRTCLRLLPTNSVMLRMH